MLRSMRENASSLFIKIILGIIVVVFIFLGIGSRDSKKLSRVAVVNDDVVTIEEYQEVYHNLIEGLRQRFGNNLNDEMIKLFQVKKQALDRLIDKKIMLQECGNLNLRVTDAELAETIKNIKVFHKEGVFNQKIYMQILSQNRLTPETFEALQREMMLIDKLRNFVVDGVKVSELEAKEWFKWNNAVVNLDFVQFLPDTYTDIKSSDEEIQQYFKDHGNNYKTEPMMKVRYLKFAPENYTSQIKIEQKAINDYFEAKSDEFQTPKMVEARHILIKLDPNADPDAVEKARLRAEEIFKKARNGNDFAELAKKYSEGPSKNDGGYLGKFAKDRMVKPFADKAFSMKAGEISEPVRTRFGWHIIKVEKVDEAFSMTLEEAAPIIRSKLTADKARNLAYDDAEAVFEAVDEGGDLQELASAKNTQLIESDFFTRQGPQQLGANRAQFAAAAFNLSDNEVSDVQELDDGYYIIQSVETRPAQIPELKDVKEKVEADLIAEKQDKAASEDAELFLSELKKNKSLSQTADKFDKTVKSTGFFKRSASIPDIGFERTIIEAAFSLSKNNIYPQNVLKGQKGYFIIGLKEKKLPTDEEYSQEKDQIKENLLSQKKNQTFMAWLRQLKEKSEIRIDERFADLF